MQRKSHRSFTSIWKSTFPHRLTQDKAVPELMRRILLPLGEELGASDLAGQAETLEQYRMQLEPYTAAAAERCQRLQRLYVSMGVLGGLLLAILLC